MEDQIKIIRSTIAEFFLKLTIDSKIEVTETADGYQFVIKTPEGGLLIGENGKNLISLNHLVKKIVTKKIGEFPNFFLDVNDYRSKKIEELKNLARLNAQRVRYFRKEIVLRPMSSFERRIIHVNLSDYPDIVTESQGRDPQRSVIIKPYP